jgi:hypothetical protein
VDRYVLPCPLAPRLRMQCHPHTHYSLNWWRSDPVPVLSSPKPQILWSACAMIYRSSYFVKLDEYSLWNLSDIKFSLVTPQTTQVASTAIVLYPRRILASCQDPLWLSPTHYSLQKGLILHAHETSPHRRHFKIIVRMLRLTNRVALFPYLYPLMSLGRAQNWPQHYDPIVSV